MNDTLKILKNIKPGENKKDFWKLTYDLKNEIEMLKICSYGGIEQSDKISQEKIKELEEGIEEVASNFLAAIPYIGQEYYKVFDFFLKRTHLGIIYKWDMHSDFVNVGIYLVKDKKRLRCPGLKYSKYDDTHNIPSCTTENFEYLKNIAETIFESKTFKADVNNGISKIFFQIPNNKLEKIFDNTGYVNKVSMQLDEIEIRRINYWADYILYSKLFGLYYTGKTFESLKEEEFNNVINYLDEILRILAFDRNQYIEIDTEYSLMKEAIIHYGNKSILETENIFQGAKERIRNEVFLDSEFILNCANKWITCNIKCGITNSNLNEVSKKYECDSLPPLIYLKNTPENIEKVNTEIKKIFPSFNMTEIRTGNMHIAEIKGMIFNFTELL